MTFMIFFNTLDPSKVGQQVQIYSNKSEKQKNMRFFV